ncbi:MAG: quinone oxidoreductase [Chromatiales bacterium]|jgi:NADPH:quinone reductase|nr:quinone oxidoreductase [Chromatiales bacterium]
MPKALRIHRNGGPEVLVVEEVPRPDFGPGEALISSRAGGINFIDIHQRAGRYPLPTLPVTLGMEGVGIVASVGQDVTQVAPGDRVAYILGGHGATPGAHCEEVAVDADSLVKLPDEIDDRTAAGMLLKGLTTHFLVHDAYPVRTGETILVHAAAGGVGLLLCQWARLLGARVIGTAGSRDKADLAIEHGCHHVILYREEPVAPRVRALTGGEGVSAVFDAVGKDTFEASLDSLKVRGTLVSFGTASGPVPPFNLFELNPRGSLYVTSAGLAWYTRSRAELLKRAGALIALVATGALKIPIRQHWPLAEARRAHEALEQRATSGMSVLDIAGSPANTPPSGQQ